MTKAENLKEKLKQALPNEKDYENFSKDINEIYTTYIKKYAFLRRSTFVWKELFIRSILVALHNPKSLISLTVSQLNATLKRTIEHDLRDPERFVHTVEGIMEYLKNLDDEMSSKVLLKELVKELNYYSVVLDENLFDRLKRESPLFLSHLNSLGIQKLSFDEFQNLLNDYNIYFKVKPLNMDIGKARILTDQYLSLMQIDENQKRSNTIAKEKVERIRCLLAYNSILSEIRSLFRKKIGPIEPEVFSWVLTAISEEELLSVFDGYSKYSYILGTKVQILQYNLSFLDIIDQHRVNCPFNPPQKDDDKQVSINHREESEEERKERAFPTVEGISPTVREQIIKSIIDSLEPIKKEQVEGYLKTAKKPISNYFLVSLDNLKRQYMRRAERFLHPLNRYEFFPLEEGFSADDRKQVVDLIFEDYAKEQKKLMLVDGFLKGCPTMLQTDFALGGRILSNSKKPYLNKLRKKVNRSHSQTNNKPDSFNNSHNQPNSKPAPSDIYGNSEEERNEHFFPTVEGISPTVREQIIKSIIDSLKQIERESVEKYLKTGNKPAVKKFFILLENLRKLYMKRTERFLHPYDRYNFFPLIEGFSDDDRRLVVDSIFSDYAKDPEKLTLVDGFLEGRPTMLQSDFAAGRTILDTSKKTYLNRMRNRAEYSTYSDIYALFPDNEEINLEIKRKIVDSIIAELGKESLQNLERLKKSIDKQDDFSYKIGYFKAFLIRQYNQKIKMLVNRIQQIQLLINQTFKIVEPPQLTFSQIYEFSEQLRLLEVRYNQSSEDSHYALFLKSNILKIFKEDPTMGLDALLSKYIAFADEEIKKAVSPEDFQM